MPFRLLQQVFPLLIIVFLTSCGSKETTTKAVRKDITQAVYASGKLFPLQYYHVASTIPGYLDTIYVKAGDEVKVGDPLFKVKNESVALALNAAENSSTTSQDLAKNLDPKTANNLKVAVKKSSQAYKTGKSLEDGVIIRARENGRVYDIMFRAGEAVAPQYPVMDLGAANLYEVVLNIDETDLNFVSVNNDVIFTAEAFPKQFFGGKVKTVNPKISLINKSIEVTASINLPPNSRIFAGSTVEGNIIFKKEKNVLVVPKMYVRDDTVLVRQGLLHKKVAVKTGIEDVEFIQILSGISENDELVKP